MFVLFGLQLLIAVTLFVVVYFLRKDKGGKEPTKALIFVPLGFGLLSMILTLVLETFLVPIDPLDPNISSASIFTLIWSCIMIGFIEEGAKFFPAALFLAKKKYFDEYADGIIYFGFIGITFSTLEHLGYALALDGGQLIFRILAILYFHASLTAILGFYFARSKILGHTWKGIIWVYLLMAMIHGFYDFGVFSGNWFFVLLALIVTITMNIMLFVYFKKALRLDRERIQNTTPVPTPPPSALTTPRDLCAHCGRENQHQTRFCIYCGTKVQDAPA